MDIQELNKITGDILRFEEKVAHTQNWLERVEKLAPLHSSLAAEVELEAKGCGGFRYNGKFSLSKEEVITVLKRNLAEQEKILDTFKEQFAKMQ